MPDPLKPPAFHRYREIHYYTPGTLDQPFPYQILAAGRSRTGPERPAHTAVYQHHTFILTLSGKGRITWAGRSTDACAATVTWLDTSQKYAHSCHPDSDHWEHIWLGMSGYGLDMLFERITGGRNPVHRANVKMRGVFEDVLQHLKDTSGVKAPISALLAAHLVEILANTDEVLEEPSSSPFHLLMTAVKNELNERWDVRKMASLAACSASHFHRKFQKVQGVSPMEWLKLERINAAKYLLSATDLSIFEVGQKCGYPDPYHFSRVFSRTVGISPTGFRKMTGR